MGCIPEALTPAGVRSLRQCVNTLYHPQSHQRHSEQACPAGQDLGDTHLAHVLECEVMTVMSIIVFIIVSPVHAGCELAQGAMEAWRKCSPGR